MSSMAEPVKKRGRPRKIKDPAAEIKSVAEAASSTTSSNVQQKLQASSRASASDSSVSSTSTRKRTTKVKPVKELPTTKTAPSLGAEKVKKASKQLKPAEGQRASAISSIMDQATAWTRDKPETSDLKEAIGSFAPSASQALKTSKSGPASSLPGKSSTTAPVPNSSRISSQSSFLSSFLDDKYQEAIPTPSEDSTISDRTAFNSSKPSIESIVSGQGISAIKDFHATSIRERASAIPIRKPKTFIAHRVSTFEENPERDPREAERKVTDPRTFTTKTFSSFKSQTPASSDAGPSPTPAIKTKSQASIGSSTSEHKVNAPVISPATVSTISRAEPIPAVTPSKKPIPPRVAEVGGPVGHVPKRPTQMSRDELVKNSDFKRLRRSWTGLIVGIPVFVVASYMLYKRYDINHPNTIAETGLFAKDRTRGQILEAHLKPDTE